MFLLFLLSVVTLIKTTAFIYIPICFYYFSEANGEANGQNKIYIPICFYYFGIKRKYLCLYHLFTFQYVSIISPLPIMTSILGKRFTFQYVSIISENDGIFDELFTIYIPICFYYFFCVETGSSYSDGNLHSNMFLLFL